MSRYYSTFPAFRSIAALMLREMSTTYGRSPGGYLWVVIEQVGVLLVFSIGFSFLLKSPTLGTSFILFYATGFLPFKIYQEISAKTASALTFSKALLAYPTITFMDAVLARFLLSCLTQVMVTYVIFVGILTFDDARVVLSFMPMLAALSMAALLGLAVGTLNCVLFDFFPVWRTLFGVITRPLMFASGVFFTFEDLPQNIAAILWYNPIIHIVGVMRRGFYPFYGADYVSTVYVCGASLICLLFGILLLKQHHRTLLQL